MTSDERRFINRELTHAQNELADLRRSNYLDSEITILNTVDGVKQRLIAIEEVANHSQLKIWREEHGTT